MKNSIKPVAAALVVAGLCAAPALSQAAETETVQRTVRYGDLNLTSLDDNAALYRRLTAAANGVCRDGFYNRDLIQSASERRCVQTSLDDAVARVNNPLLSILNGSYEPRLVFVHTPVAVVNVIAVVEQ